MSFMLPADPRPSSRRARTYGWRRALIQIAGAAVCSVVLAGATTVPSAHAQAPVKIVAFGDSLTAGYGLPDNQGFVPRLQAALAAKDIAADIQNAGVSGDTASDGLARLDWSVPEGTEAVILELGGHAILRRLTARHIAVLLCGMRSAPNLGPEYGTAFERVYPDLAAKYDVLIYPFFLDGAAADLKLLH